MDAYLMKTTIVASSEFIIKTQMINFYAALEHNHAIVIRYQYSVNMKIQGSWHVHVCV